MMTHVDMRTAQSAGEGIAIRTCPSACTMESSCSRNCPSCARQRSVVCKPVPLVSASSWQRALYLLARVMFSHDVNALSCLRCHVLQSSACHSYQLGVSNRLCHNGDGRGTSCATGVHMSRAASSGRDYAFGTGMRTLCDKLTVAPASREREADQAPAGRS
jgi:hypothetical protein